MRAFQVSLQIEKPVLIVKEFSSLIESHRTVAFAKTLVAWRKLATSFGLIRYSFWRAKQNKSRVPKKPFDK